MPRREAAGLAGAALLSPAAPDAVAAGVPSSRLAILEPCKTAARKNIPMFNSGQRPAVRRVFYDRVGY